jgi:hypothetical protein
VLIATTYPFLDVLWTFIFFASVLCFLTQGEFDAIKCKAPTA